MSSTLQRQKRRPRKKRRGGDGVIYTCSQCVFRQVAESIEHMLILPVERFASSGVEAQLAIMVDRERSVPVQLNLIHPFRPVREF